MPTYSRDTDSDRPSRGRSGRGRTGDRRRRIASAVFGGALVVRGLRRRSLRGILTALAGAWLVSRAVGGPERIRAALGSRARSGERTLPAGTGADRSRTDGTGPPADEPTVSRTVTVGKPAEELFEVWRDPVQFSRIMGHFADVTARGEDRFHWTVRAPGGREISWDTYVVEEEPGELLRWETAEGARLPNEGEVRFRPAPGDRGTQVTLRVRFDPPGGTLGTAALRRLDLVPETFVAEALRRFKSLVESGVIQTLEENPSDRGTGDVV
ncbi:cyclase [Halobacteriales archaeon QS_8_69_26]|nr:MAG: cyclase [Halobacteriales archaeon QS_8_69_26]